MATNNAALDRFIRDLTPRIDGGDGQWTLIVDGIDMMVMTHQDADRMRILSPVAASYDMDLDLARILLEANFHSALDARYAVWRGSVWSVFIHPLSSLSEAAFRNAVSQVAELRRTFGTTYCSSGYVFGRPSN